MSEAYSGNCFCGAVSIEAQGTPAQMGYCHCTSCRSYAGAPVSAFTLWSADQVKVVQGEDKLGGFNKTGFSYRRFCSACGGHVLVEHPTLGMVDIHASTIPGLTFEPAVHLNYGEHVLRMVDGLPKLKDFPAEIGGTGEAVPE
ncbi:GFA family protein [Novosphingobium sp. Gsoil 351]|uniref:GFA family protein n=1 Tax=Novosphingobium sp. Gsoil 351 TaxID=2675225 RepID=UPI0012B4E81E|nr:GFA family protein [Novosphingobium sp. Gsoil 351]QGN53549.1 GFA family protein [Novosphingobium sp. Gsoil 351]